MGGYPELLVNKVAVCLAGGLAPPSLNLFTNPLHLNPNNPTFAVNVQDNGFRRLYLLVRFPPSGANVCRISDLIVRSASENGAQEIEHGILFDCDFIRRAEHGSGVFCFFKDVEHLDPEKVSGFVVIRYRKSAEARPFVRDSSLDCWL